MSRDVALLVNPTANKGRAVRLVEPVAARLRDAGCTVRVLAGADVEQARRLAADQVAAAVEVLAVLGGDGMAHLGLQAVAGAERTAFGIVPAGTGNDLAAVVGIPADPLAAADAIAHGTVRTVDLGRSAGSDGARWWGTVLCAGFDSRINERANAMRWPSGRRRYDLATYAELALLKPVAAEVVVDGEPWRGDVTLVAVGNGSRYGGGQYICPDAVVDDGLLDVTVVRPLSRAKVVMLKPKLPKGTLRDHPDVVHLRGREVRLSLAGTVAYADGERLGALPMTITAEPGALRVLVP